MNRSNMPENIKQGILTGYPQMEGEVVPAVLPTLIVHVDIGGGMLGQIIFRVEYYFQEVAMGEFLFKYREDENGRVIYNKSV